MTLIGIFAMRWNVVIGGQLFSKSFLGYTTYKMTLVTREGLLVSIALTLLPLRSCGPSSNCCLRGRTNMRPTGCRGLSAPLRPRKGTDRVKTMNVLPEALEKLTSRVDALEKRVHDLNIPPRHSRRPPRNFRFRRRRSYRGVSQSTGEQRISGTRQGDAGHRGAYVLRAVAESSLVPRQAIAAVAIVYAVAWLVWSGDSESRRPALCAARSTPALPP